MFEWYTNTLADEIKCYVRYKKTLRALPVRKSVPLSSYKTMIAHFLKFENKNFK